MRTKQSNFYMFHLFSLRLKLSQRNNAEFSAMSTLHFIKF